jgi:hypothetical protein
MPVAAAAAAGRKFTMGRQISVLQYYSGLAAHDSKLAEPKQAVNIHTSMTSLNKVYGLLFLAVT